MQLSRDEEQLITKLHQLAALGPAGRANYEYLLTTIQEKILPWLITDSVVQNQKGQYFEDIVIEERGKVISFEEARAKKEDLPR